ncbi:putative membrane protein [Saccharothrix tamanrassetensis]|uniref:Putative membrane protein n=1 Tax=Saccharothrix tamanrassetensis TaxID=1051531 RepID=A0A841CFZ7_9PSEU|nr:DUF1772 domain-containing protein [Saccharothrix tamanrassetensis]MBB5957452.1 putative membrane protein [Saccharothrix tamanrassetensis]
MTAVLVLVALSANGLAAGVLLWSAVCGVPLLRTLAPDRYIEVELLWGNRFEPFQPICVVLTALADVLLAVTGPGGPARPLFGVAAVAAALVVAVSATRNVPMKRWVMSLDPAHPPEDFADADPRPDWARWNLTRTVLAIVAFGANVVAVVTVLPT